VIIANCVRRGELGPGIPVASGIHRTNGEKHAVKVRPENRTAQCTGENEERTEPAIYVSLQRYKKPRNWLQKK
jgi:hypothetical protein